MNSAIIRFFVFMTATFSLVLFAVLVILRVIALENLNAYTNIALWGILTILLMLFVDSSRNFYIALQQMSSNRYGAPTNQAMSNETKQLLEYHQALQANSMKKRSNP